MLMLWKYIISIQADGPGAEEEESDKSRSEVNDDEEDDEEGSGEVLWINN